ncbi:transcriptional regulator [Aliihoeflea sp. PC F10.4]
MNDNEEPRVIIIVGQVWRSESSAPERINVLLRAPDDDTAVRMTLEALKREGYGRAELDQIGELEGMPDEEPHMSAWQGAMEGEIAIVTM